MVIGSKTEKGGKEHGYRQGVGMHVRVDFGTCINLLQSKSDRRKDATAAVFRLCFSSFIVSRDAPIPQERGGIKPSYISDRGDTGPKFRLGSGPRRQGADPRSACDRPLE